MSIFFIKIIISLLFILFKHCFSTTSFPKYLSSNIIEDIRNLLFLLPEGKIITFNNSLINITLYNTSDNYFSYDKMNINFENCLTILQKIYDLDPFFDYTNNDNNEIYKRCFFIIIKIELDRKLIKESNNTFTNNSNENNTFDDGLISDSINENDGIIINNNNITKYPTNHIEYLIFNGKNGDLLNTSYCNDLNVKISHPISDKNGIDLNISKKFYEEYKIDVYRANDSFFNDFCMNYTSDKNTDLTLSQRRSFFYQNVSFCDSNCNYIQVNYTSNTAICACEVKNGIMNDVLLNGGKEYRHQQFSYSDAISLINYKIFQCYKEVFNLDRLKYNVGSYTSIIIIAFYTACIIHFVFNRKRNVMSYFQKVKLKMEETKNEEKCKERNKENSLDKGNGNNINCQCNNDNISDLCHSYQKNKFNKKRSININGIIITDLANPSKKKKIKISINNDKNIESILKSNNSITKITETQVRNYGDIKIDTGDELLNKRSEEKGWDEIITLKKKNINNGQKKQKNKNYIQLTSGNSSSILSSTKHNTIKSKDKKLDALLTKTITQNNLFNYNNLNFFSSPNYSVEIPISNIMPSFLKPKKILINKSRNKNISEGKDLTCSQTSQNNFILKKTKTKCSNAIYNNYLTKNDFIINKDNDNNENNMNKNCIIIEDCSDKNNFTLRRIKEIVHKKKSKDKKYHKDNSQFAQNSYNNYFGEFDDMKFEIAILIDNRNFCDKFLCEIKDNCIILILFFRNDIMFKQLQLSSFILSCTLDFFFNALFYNEIYLKKRYEENKLIAILIDYPKEIFSCLVSQFIVKLLELLIEDKFLTSFLKRIASQNKYYLKGVSYLLKRYERRFYIYISIGFFLLFITWYYTSAFCTVYQNSQMKLLYDTLESLVLNLILPLPISFLSMSFRHLAIKKLNKFLFIISNIIRIFA